MFLFLWVADESAVGLGVPVLRDALSAAGQSSDLVGSGQVVGGRNHRGLGVSGAVVLVN